MRAMFLAFAAACMGLAAVPASAQQGSPGLVLSDAREEIVVVRMVNQETRTVTLQGPDGNDVSVKQIQARVDAINYGDRTVVLSGPEGKQVKLVVDERVQRLNEVKVGAIVVVRYTEALGMKMIKQ